MVYEAASLSLPRRLSQVTRYACGILLLTSIHHVYGAYVYATPWRVHIVVPAIAAAAVIAAAAGVFRRYRASSAATIAFAVLCVVTLVFPFAMIGLFEGGYNHVLKDLLYFGGAPAEQMQRLFPPPTYEMPSDAFFELTGIAQLPAGVAGIRHLWRLVRDWWEQRAGSNAAAAASQQHVI
jgi:hypothetical protein